MNGKKVYIYCIFIGESLTISGTDAEHPRILYIYILFLFLILSIFIYTYIYIIFDEKRDVPQGRTTCAPVFRPAGKVTLVCFRDCFRYKSMNYLYSTGTRFARHPLKGCEHQSYAADRAEARAAGLCGRPSALAVDADAATLAHAPTRTLPCAMEQQQCSRAAALCAEAAFCFELGIRLLWST